MSKIGQGTETTQEFFVEKPFPAYQGDGPYIFVNCAHDDADLVFPEIQRLQDQVLTSGMTRFFSPKYIQETVTAATAVAR